MQLLIFTSQVEMNRIHKEKKNVYLYHSKMNVNFSLLEFCRVFTTIFGLFNNLGVLFFSP